MLNYLKAKTFLIPNWGNPITFRIEDNVIGERQYPRTPVVHPSVALQDHTLYLYSGCDNTTIELLDESEAVVFSTQVAEGTETIELPAGLTGTYQLRVIRGSLTFVGEIEL